MIRLALLAFIFLVLPVKAQHGDITTYRVTMLRAAAGEWKELKALIEAQGAPGQQTVDGNLAPFRIRHSQGDQWDFMLMEPLKGNILPRDTEFWRKTRELADFSEDWVVEGPALRDLKTDFANAGLYHVEIFRAKAGLHDALLKQRMAENAYLKATGQVTNAIFTGRFGADWDVMTIGFHESLQSFAQDAPASAEEKDKAARQAGFDGVNDLAPYLRSLLVSHNDTLAVSMD